MSLFPMFVKLRDRLCIVVGGGQVAEAKIPGLIAAEAKIRIIAPDVTDSLAARAREGQIEWLRKTFEPARSRRCLPRCCGCFSYRSESRSFSRG